MRIEGNKEMNPYLTGLLLDLVKRACEEIHKNLVEKDYPESTVHTAALFGSGITDEIGNVIIALNDIEIDIKEVSSRIAQGEEIPKFVFDEYISNLMLINEVLNIESVAVTVAEIQSYCKATASIERLNPSEIGMQSNIFRNYILKMYQLCDNYRKNKGYGLEYKSYYLWNVAAITELPLDAFSFKYEDGDIEDKVMEDIFANSMEYVKEFRKKKDKIEKLNIPNDERCLLSNIVSSTCSTCFIQSPMSSRYSFADIIAKYTAIYYIRKMNDSKYSDVIIKSIKAMPLYKKYQKSGVQGVTDSLVHDCIYLIKDIDIDRLSASSNEDIVKNHINAANEILHGKNNSFLKIKSASDARLLIIVEWLIDNIYKDYADYIDGIMSYFDEMTKNEYINNIYCKIKGKINTRKILSKYADANGNLPSYEDILIEKAKLEQLDDREIAEKIRIRHNIDMDKLRGISNDAYSFVIHGEYLYDIFNRISGINDYCAPIMYWCKAVETLIRKIIEPKLHDLDLHIINGDREFTLGTLPHIVTRNEKNDLSWSGIEGKKWNGNKRLVMQALGFNNETVFEDFIKNLYDLNNGYRVCAAHISPASSLDAQKCYNLVYVQAPRLIAQILSMW